MKNVILYTDGACSFNPGPGGWGCLLMYGEHKKEISGGEEKTTNNRMELTAVIQGLKELTEPCCVQVYSDSAYVVNAFLQNWINSWIAKGWKNANKDPVQNQDLWEELIALTKIHKVEWNKVKGHADNPYNNRCDELARMETEKFLKKD